MPAKILVTDAISEDGLAKLRSAGFEVVYKPGIKPEELKEIIGDATAWLIRSASKATAEYIGLAKNLKVIGRAGVGVDNVDVEAATKRGIVVMNTPSGNTISTAEHTVALLLSMVRRIPDAVASMRDGKWDRKSYTGTEIEGKTMAIFGLGRIGQCVARRMKGFGVHIVGHDPFVSREYMQKLGIEPGEPDDMCRRADLISVHTTLSPETRDLIDARRIGLMKKTAYIVNCARGGIVNEQALAAALKEGRIAGAALDVFEEEPLPAENCFKGVKNAILTPHIAASTTEAQENVAIQVAEQVIDFLRSGLIRNAVNAPSVEPELLQSLRSYLMLVEKLGSFAAQIGDGAVTKFEITYSGAILEKPLAPLTTAAVKGYLSALSDEPINFVNALALMRQRGIEVVETSRHESHDFASLVTVAVTYEHGGRNSVSGTVFEPNRPRIVLVNDKSFDTWPYGHVVVIENQDVPGIIGSVGTVFGRHGINIAQMTWGRTERDQTALTVINVDQRVPKDVMAEIRSLGGILTARVMSLS